MINKLGGAAVAETRPTYDPRAHGCRCDDCPLRGHRPVPPDVRPGAKLVILGESPGEHEEAEGRSFIGASGKRLNRALDSIGLHRSKVHVTNAILCRPLPKMRPEQWEGALAACRPRLEEEINGLARSDISDRANLGSGGNLLLPNPPVIFAAGAKALQTLTGKANITPWMGAPLESDLGTVLPSIHPAFALRKPAYIPIFRTFLARAARLAYGQSRPWQWPQLVWAPAGERERIEALTKLLSSPRLAIDIENYPSTGALRCIGVGNAELVVSIPFPMTAECNALLRELLAADTEKIYHNAQHDIASLKAQGYVLGGTVFDTMLAHAVVAPQLPHNLSEVATYELTAERWKTHFKVTGEDKGKALVRFEKAPLEELLPYNAKDVAATAILRERLGQRIENTHRGPELLQNYHDLDRVAMRMREIGIKVARENFAGHEVNLNNILAGITVKFRELVPDPSFELGASGQHPSLNKLFFKVFGVTPVSHSEETGAPSLDGKALTRYVAEFQTKFPLISQLAALILRFRKHAKLLGSYITNLPVNNDDLVHPTWRVFGARTGRWSATDPAMQTIPKPNKKAGTPGMRDIFCARPGNVILELDYSQLELRIVALLSGDEKLLDWYAQGLDVHTMNARDIFKTDKPTDQQRDLAKRVVYGMNYGGAAETIWRSIVVDFPTAKLGAVEYVMEQWFKHHPKIKTWQDAQVDLAKERKYVEEALSGRRQYYHDGNVKPTEVLNYPVQGAAGTIVNRAVLRIAEALNWADEYLLMQVHDSVVIEVPEVRADKAVHMAKEALEADVELNGAVVRFPVDAKKGYNWGVMTKVAA